MTRINYLADLALSLVAPKLTAGASNCQKWVQRICPKYGKCNCRVCYNCDGYTPCDAWHQC